MPTSTDTLVIGAGAAGLFAAWRWAARGSVTVIEAGPDAGNPLPRLGAATTTRCLRTYYHRYTDPDTGTVIRRGAALAAGPP